MRIFLIESNIHIKKTVQDFTLLKNAVSLQKLITVPLDISRLKKELSEEVPNILILNVDNFKSSQEELGEFLKGEQFRYTSFIFTSKEKDMAGKFLVKNRFIQLHGYATKNNPETTELQGVLSEKLEAFGKIKSKIKNQIKKINIKKIEKGTEDAILKVSKGIKRSIQSTDKANPELDRVVPDRSVLVNKKMVVIGSSIGGVEVLHKIISSLPSDGSIPPILITQHISSKFTKGLVSRLNRANDNINVQEGKSNMILLPNNVYVAPGEKHMGIMKNGFDVVVRIFDDEVLVSKHKPSIDVLYRSVNNIVGKNALAIILTGMGKDGVQGMGELCKSGALTLAQEKKSCTVQGIGGECIVRGYIKKELSVEDIVEYIKNF